MAAVESDVSSSTDQLLLEFSSFETGYPIEYNGFLSNHLTHGVVALTAVYAGHKEQLTLVRAFAEDYIQSRPDLIESKEKPKKKTDIDDEVLPEWKDLLKSDMLGQMKDFPLLMTRVKHDLVTKFDNNTDRLVRSRFLDTLAGLSGAALHPLIHLGFAIYSGNQAMIIEGLAYSVFGYRQLWDLTAISESESAIKPSSDLSSGYGLLSSLKSLFTDLAIHDSIIAKVSEDTPRWKKQLKMEGRFQMSCFILGQSILVKQIVDAHVSAILAAIDDQFVMDDSCVALCRSIMTLALGSYNAVKVNDFFVLHCVTSAFALCQIIKVMDSVDTRKEMVGHFLEAVCLFYMALGCPDLIGISELKLDSDIGDRTIKFDTWFPSVKERLAEEMKSGVFKDEHCYKLLFVCSECVKNEWLSSSSSDTTEPSTDFQAICAVEKSLSKAFVFGGFVNETVLE